MLVFLNEESYNTVFTKSSNYWGLKTISGLKSLLILGFLSFHINFIISLLVYRENKDKRIKTHVW